jgi:ribonuclease Y
MAQMEAKIIQKDTLLSQKLEEVQRKKKEVDTLQVNLNNQAEALKKREEEVEKIHRQHLEKLEVISGLTAKKQSNNW